MLRRRAALTMQPVPVLTGLAAMLYGFAMLYLRRANPMRFRKLGAMKERWGARAGTALHVAAYSVVPIVAGGVLVVVGCRGASLF